MEALFACTKCHSRHPFEDLSGSEQLCKECRNNYPIVKCTYCRSEFQQTDKSNTNSICKKCAYNIKIHGKPSACLYCTVIAAFIGKKCQRCTNSEKKFGGPLICDQCKQRCAFDRKDGNQRKMDGRLLCWLCSKTYKKVLARSWLKGQESLHTTPLSSNDDTPKKSTPPAISKSSQSAASKHGTHEKRHKRRHSHDKGSEKTEHRNRHHRSERKRESDGKHRESLAGEEKESEGLHDKTTTKPKTEDAQTKGKENGDSVIAKKPKLEKPTTNGLVKSSPSSTFSDFTSSEHMVLITQLREEIEAGKKQLLLREQAILERDRKITELKASNFEAEKEMRNKVLLLTRQHNEAIETFRVQNRELQRQVASLTKNSRKTERSEKSLSYPVIVPKNIDQDN